MEDERKAHGYHDPMLGVPALYRTDLDTLESGQVLVLCDPGNALTGVKVRGLDKFE
jgi:hypothetical protein